jgi:orotate phosphoribosyltransferase
LTTLIEMIIDAGLIQFGGFGDQPMQAPVQFKLEMLASYPELLEVIASRIGGVIDVNKIDHLLCTPDAIPLAVAVSLQTKIPLIYSRIQASGAIELIGAYDIGHPALLVTNMIDVSSPGTGLISHASRFGLEIVHIVGVIDCERGDLSQRVEHVTLMRLSEIVRKLSQNGQLPTRQAQAVLDWISR